VRNLPDESQTIRAIGGSIRPGQWHNVEELLATLIETVFEGHRLLFSIHSKKGRRPPDAIKVPRPAGTAGQTQRKRQSTTEELLEVFGPSKNVVIRYTPKKEEE
jgi:hypothetical protein